MRPILLFLAALTCIGCSTSRLHEGMRLNAEGRYQESIGILQNWIVSNPNDHEAWRELGVAYYHLQDYSKAEAMLKQAAQIRDEARTQLYLGFLLENNGELGTAIQTFNRALALEGSKSTRRMLSAHLFNLLKQKAILDVRAAMDRELSLDAGQTPENSISVIPFDPGNLSKDLTPLAFGLAELTTIDLSKVESLIVTERLKIVTLLKELELSRTHYVDDSSRLRIGKLIRCNWLVGGSLQSSPDAKRISFVGVLDQPDSTSQKELLSEGKVKDFFKIEKDLVFGVIDQLGIVLSPQERASIEQVPTKSMLALLAYSRGLNLMYDGYYSDAESEFRAAAREDPYFQDARDKAELMTEVNLMASHAEGSGKSEEDVLLAQSDQEESPETQELALTNLIHQSQFIPSSEAANGGDIVENPPRTGSPGYIDIILTGTIE